MVFTKLFPKEENTTVRTAIKNPEQYRGLLFHLNITKEKISVDDVVKAIKDDYELREAFKDIGNKKYHRSFKTPILKVLSQVHPDHDIDEEAIKKIDQLANYLVDKIIEASQREGLFLNTANRILIGELNKHALMESQGKLIKFEKRHNIDRFIK
jgi:hypothetical protein